MKMSLHYGWKDKSNILQIPVFVRSVQKEWEPDSGLVKPLIIQDTQDVHNIRILIRIKKKGTI